MSLREQLTTGRPLAGNQKPPHEAAATDSDFDFDGDGILRHVAQNAEKLLQVIHGLEAEPAEPLKFDCMPDWENSAISQNNLRDQRTWRQELPSKVAVYHAFMRTAAQNTREHKIFMVVSRHCRHASEELYNRVGLECTPSPCFGQRQ